MPVQIQDTSYSGRAASPFISTAITGADTIQGGHIMVVDDIRKRFSIPTLEIVDDVIQERIATPTVGTESIVGVRTLEPLDLMVYQEINPRDFETHWQAENLNPSLVNRTLPITFEDFLIRRINQKVAKEIEALIWRGDTASSSTSLSRFDGLIKLLKADTNTITVPEATALTAGNVISKMQGTYNLLPDALKFNPLVKFYVSYKTAGLYQQAQQAQPNKGVSIIQEGQWQINGRPVVKCAGMPDDTILATIGNADFSSNIWMGVNSTDNENQVLLDKVANNSELYFIKILMKACVNYAFANQAVLYSIPANQG